MLLILLLALAAYIGVSGLLGGSTVHALPEYTTRTGESCATCHVSAGGGGPRTLRGLLWSARGRPDQVPELPGLQLAPGVTSGAELYDIACTGCHGLNGEGLLGISLANRPISRGAHRSFILRGIPNLGMPAFEGQLSDAQLEALVDFVTAMGRGEVLPDEFPLPPPELACDPVAPSTCGGNQ